MKSMLALLVLLLGFTAQSAVADPIERVKGTLYPYDVTRTYGQVLDYRPTCSSVSWDLAKTMDGRDVVGYNCILKGIEGVRANDNPDLIDKWGPIESMGERIRYLLGADGRLYFLENFIFITREVAVIKIPLEDNEYAREKIEKARAFSRATTGEEYLDTFPWAINNDLTVYYDMAGNEFEP